MAEDKDETKVTVNIPGMRIGDAMELAGVLIRAMDNAYQDRLKAEKPR